VLGTVPTQKRIVLERFFDESGGMQLVLHAPFGGKINRAWGLALRKRFCRGFGFELQAAANEEAIVLSLGVQHSFALEDVFNYLHPASVRQVLTQAVLAQPMFESRWRWNATRSLVLERFQGGKAVPPQILRMRAADLLGQTFPAAIACPENLPAGDLPVPMEHPLVRQTIEDCLTEATDLAGLIEVLEGLRSGEIERVAVDTPEPSAFARGILHSELYTFLDDAPLEERRTQAVLSRRGLEPKLLDHIGALDPAAVQRVREEAWPEPESAEEAHDALLWKGYITDAEVGGAGAGWQEWLRGLAGQQRVVHHDGLWFAADGMGDPTSREGGDDATAMKILLGRLEALGPVAEDDPRIRFTDAERTQALLLKLEHSGAILRSRLEGHAVWCERRLLARINRYTLERLRREIQPATAGEFLRFLAAWQHVAEGYRLEGPVGVSEVLRQLAGLEAPAWAWEKEVLPRRVQGYRQEWLDAATVTGEFAWGRMWGGSAAPIRMTPIALMPREELETWLSLAPAGTTEGLSGPAKDLLAPLRAQGAMFPQSLQQAARLVQAHLEMGLADLVSHGLATCDSFAGLRQMMTPPSRRSRAMRPVGRWSCFRAAAEPAEEESRRDDAATEMVARQLLSRMGVVFRRVLLRERIPVTWSALSRIYRRMELRGEVRGGRIVAGFSGEQFALPEAVELLRKVRRQGTTEPLSVAAADPLNFQGILTPEKRTAVSVREEIRIAGGETADAEAEAYGRPGAVSSPEWLTPPEAPVVPRSPARGRGVEE